MKTTKKLALAALVSCIGISPLAVAQDLVSDREARDVRDAVSDTGRDHTRDGVRLRCGSVGMGATAMRSRYAVRRGEDRVRVSFGAAFEAAAGGPFSEGDLLAVRLAGIRVGEVMLEQHAEGFLFGRLELHATHDQDDAVTDVEWRRIRVRNGTSVVVGPLGCALDR